VLRVDLPAGAMPAGAVEGALTSRLSLARGAAGSLRPASLLRNAFLAMAGRRTLARELGDR
jgi:hypothetical protein